MSLQNDIFAYYHSVFGHLPGKDPSGWVKVLCPFHRDRNPSLGINLKSGGFFCFGCGAKGSQEEFHMKINGVDFKTACREIAKIPSMNDEITNTYDYTDDHGKIVFQACRYPDKKFRLRRPDNNGGWIWNLNGVQLVPYHLPDVIKSDTVFICEGKKTATI